MKNKKVASWAALVLLIVVLAGCSSPASEPPAVNVTGTWQGSMNAGGIGSETIRFRLEQSGSAVTGDFSAADRNLFHVLGEVSGRVSGSRVNLTLTLDTTVTDPGGGSFTGTVSGNSFSGSGTLRNDAAGESAQVTFSVTQR